MNKKGLLLLSGGLDSILAGKLMLEQGIELHALHFSSTFGEFKSKNGNEAVIRRAENLKIPLKHL